MRHHIFEEAGHYRVAILIKGTAFFKMDLTNTYVDPLVALGVPKNEIIAFTLDYNENDKAPAGFIKEYLAKLLPALDSLHVSHLYCADTAYFKVLTGKPKADPHHGYVLPCKIKGFEHMNVVLGVNYRTLIFDPSLQSKLDQGLAALASHRLGTYQEPGQGIIHSAHYPKDDRSIELALEEMLHLPELTCDIEGFSLEFDKAGIGTISFGYNQHNGIAFAVDYHEYLERPAEGYYGYQLRNYKRRELLRSFFERYKGKLIFHSSAYDVKVLIANLWMKDLLDTEGLLRGLEILHRDLEDTKIIAYLATNSTAGNVLGLKALAHEFAGNWAVEVADIRKVPLDQLLQYNLVDALCTHYVRSKYEPVMWNDNQVELYRNLMLPSQKMLTQLELTGMPLNKQRVQEVKAELLQIQQQHLDTIQASPTVALVNQRLQREAQAAANAKLKIKQHPIEKFADVVLNPNSPQQLQKLLYDEMRLPVLDLTDTKQPAAGAETIEKLINHTSDPDHKAVLEALIGYGTVTKILSTFIPAFEQAIEKDTLGTIVWLHGNFNIGGTVSGRLSSSDPNLQNIPAGATGSEAKKYYGKLIKSCFQAPEGWLFCGADFNSLEDYISALTTRDPNKLAVYERGFDGHCLRAAYYFRSELLHIDLDSSASVNSIKKTHPHLRQDSKTPTFALTYQGTYHTLMTNLGWSEEKAKAIEASYHELYKVSDQYVQDKLKQASKDGYVTVAFGLRVRTPLIAQVLWGSKKMPYEAAAEGRTAGNALGQSYGLLNNRAAVAFMEKVWASEFRYDIKPIALIHDAIYILVRDRADVVEFANNELINAMRWQELPEIQHPTVKLGAELNIYWPSWAYATTIPNDVSREKLIEICHDAKKELLAAKK